jgi:hypothetical protein
MIKKKLPEIYYDEYTKDYFSSDLVCEITNEPIVGLAVLIRGYSQSKKIANNFVVSRFDVRKEAMALLHSALFEYVDVIIINVVRRIPSRAYLYIFPTPGLKNSRSDLSVFDAASKQLGDEVVVDRTVVSGREGIGFDNDLLAKRDESLRLADEKSSQSFDDPFDYLKELQSSGEKLIASVEKKELEFSEVDEK